MKATRIHYFLCLSLTFILFSCSDSTTESDTIDQEDQEVVMEEEEVEEEEPKRQKRVKHDYDLTVITESCREWLDTFEEIQVKMVDAKKKYETNKKDEELAEKYFDLISKNSKFMSDPKTADCAGDLNFQYALDDIADRYSKQLNDEEEK